MEEKKPTELDKIEKEVIKINTRYHKSYISNFALKLSLLYKRRPSWVYILISAFIGFIFGVISLFFVKNTGLYNFGIAAIGQGIAKLTVALLHPILKNEPYILNVIDQSIFWFLYVLVSVPLFVFSYKKLGKEFTIITLVFLIFQNAGGFLIGIIPNTSGLLFGQIGSNLSGSLLEIKGVLPIGWTEGGSIIVMVVYAVLYGLLLAIVFAVVAIMGGTAGVSGIFGEWYSQEKRKSFATISGYMNLIIMVFSILIGSYIAGSIVIQNNASKITNISAWSFDLYLSPNFFATFVSNFVFVFLMNELYPRYKFVKVEIYTKHMSKVRNVILRDRKMVNSLSIHETRGGYSLEKQNILVSIALFSHVQRMIRKVQEVDPDAFVAVIRIRNISGWVYIPDGKF